MKRLNRMKITKSALIAALLLPAFVWTGCHQSNSGSTSMLTGDAVIAADESLKPLINAQLDIFHSIYQFSNIHCRYITEDSAVNLLQKEEIRLAIIGRPLNEKEVEFFKSRELIPESIPMATDAIALIVQTANNTEAFSIEQIKNILSGKITDWSQIEDSGKSGSIQLIFDTESSGIIRYLNEKLELKNQISGNVIFAGSNEQVIDSIAGNANGIGFVGYNWLSETESIKVQEKLKEVHFIGVSATSNAMTGDSAFMPSVSSLYNGKYPLSRKVYAIYTDPSASLARGFLALLTSERGQRIVYRNGLKSEHDFQRLIKIKEDY